MLRQGRVMSLRQWHRRVAGPGKRTTQLRITVRVRLSSPECKARIQHLVQIQDMSEVNVRTGSAQCTQCCPARDSIPRHLRLAAHRVVGCQLERHHDRFQYVRVRTVLSSSTGPATLGLVNPRIPMTLPGFEG